MFFILIKVSSFALLCCPLLADDSTRNAVVPEKSTTHRKRNLNEFKNSEYSGNVATVFQNLGTVLISFFKEVLKSEGQTHDEDSGPSLKRKCDKSNTIFTLISDFVKNTRTIISKAFSSDSSQSKTNKYETGENSQKPANTKQAPLTMKPEASRHSSVENSDDCSMLEKPAVRHPVRHPNNGNRAGGMAKGSQDISMTKPELMQNIGTSNGNMLVGEKPNANVYKNTSLDKEELIEEVPLRKQSNQTLQTLASEILKEDNGIKFMTHSEEYQKVWKPVFKINEEQRQNRMTMKYISWVNAQRENDQLFLNRTLKNSSDEFMTHSEEYKRKWGPLIGQTSHIKPGRRLHPGRTFKQKAVEPIDLKSVEASRESPSSPSEEPLNCELKTSTKAPAQVQSLHGNTGSTRTDGKHEQSVNKGMLQFTKDFVGPSVKSQIKLSPWAENRFKRVSNNIGLDQHIKTSGGKSANSVMLTARPNASRISYDRVFDWNYKNLP